MSARWALLCALYISSFYGPCLTHMTTGGNGVTPEDSADRPAISFTGMPALGSLARRALMRLEKVYYDHLAAGVLALPALPVPESGSVAVHILTSRHDWLCALWALRSLLGHLGRAIPVSVHDDGSLDARAVRAITACLPGVRVISRDVADQAAASALADLPKCRQLRANVPLALKLFDPWVIAPVPERAILVDSDVVFLALPTELRDWIESGDPRNLWTKDVKAAYSVPAHELSSRLGFEVVDRVNTGVGAVWRESVDFLLVERLLREPEIESVPWFTEQTCYAVLSSRFGLSFLPEERYLLSLDPNVSIPEGTVMKHYVRAIRRRFYTEGIPVASKRLSV